jgi:hypothetical protein
MNVADQLLEAIIACLARPCSRERPALIEACQLVGLIVGISSRRTAIDEIEQLLQPDFGREFVCYSLLEALNGNPTLEQRYITLIAQLANGVEEN